MRKRSKLGLLLAAIACAGVVAPQAQADVVIDLFDGPRHDVIDTSFNGTGEWDSEGAVPGVIQSSRELYAFRGHGEAGANVEIVVDEGVAIEEWSPDLDPNLNVAHITWDGGADDSLTTTGLGGVDLTANGEDRFFIESDPVQNSATAGDAELSVEVWDMDGTRVEGFLTIPGGPAATETKFYLSFLGDFSVFDPGTTLGFDWSNVGAIRMNFLSDNARVNSFSAVVPVPPAVGLGLLGMFIVGGIRRRKNKVQA